jgi:hypothetical protein
MFDAHGDGVFELTNVTPSGTPQLSALAFDPNVHQPFVDEFVLGDARQFKGQMRLDVSATRRAFKDGCGEIHINGVYPSAPNQPFGGFGRVDPVFGPGQIRLANGTTQPNPLATAWRFAYPTRSEGQVLNERRAICN